MRRVAALALALALASPAGAAGPRTTSLEYRKSWGLEAIGAQAAYHAGLSGRGVTVALIDCGLTGAQREVRRNVYRSTDVVEGRSLPDTDPHGSFVAAPLASPLNGYGMVGVAYNASLLVVRADVDGGSEGACAFRQTDLARALDYATAQRARIVVLPMQARRRLNPAFEAALARLVDSGAVVVIAAGNWQGAQPSYPARYAAEPRYAGGIVVAGATSYYGALTPWTNRAGAAKAWYIAAPGEWILTNCRGRCALVSGTSFSTSYVAGAIALVMEQDPKLSGRDAVRRVLDSARDLGAAGVDDESGHGALDLGRVFAGG
jgi:subtilisin family serine protease